MEGFLRYIWITFGCAALALGVIGAFLPLLPTVPFLLLAAFCFSKGSERMHSWLLNHKSFGPPIEEWHKHGAIASRVKLYALSLIFLSVFLSFLYGVPTVGLVSQVILLSCVSLFILTRPTPPRPTLD
ncbi:MAG: YbaN family protein [Kordiimonadaceae bacterium]|nr:YbaN family protein [Kordiimonadaceae bacterium]